MYNIDMKEDQFTKLFKYVQGIDQKVDVVKDNMATRSDLNRLTETIDNFFASIVGDDFFLHEMTTAAVGCIDALRAM